MPSLQQGLSDGLQGKTKEELVSYVMQIEKCLDEMRELTADMADGFYKEDVERILNRVKADK